MLSVDGDHVSEMLVAVAPDAARFAGVDGGIVSPPVDAGAPLLNELKVDNRLGCAASVFPDHVHANVIIPVCLDDAH